MPAYRLPLIWSGCVFAVAAAVLVLHGLLSAPTGVSLALTMVLGVASVPTARHIERATRPHGLRPDGHRASR